MIYVLTNLVPCSDKINLPGTECLFTSGQQWSFGVLFSSPFVFCCWQRTTASFFVDFFAGTGGLSISDIGSFRFVMNCPEPLLSVVISLASEMSPLPSTPDISGFSSGKSFFFPYNFGKALHELFCWESWTLEQRWEVLDVKSNILTSKPMLPLAHVI